MAPSKRDNSPLIDSLPYIDQVHQDYEDYAMALIDQEMQGVDADAEHHPRTRPLPSVAFRTKLMETEYQTLVVDGQFQERNHLKFVEKLANGTALKELGIDAMDDDSKLQKATKHARSRYEAERLRTMTLEAEKEESTKHWKGCVDGWLQIMKIGHETSLKRQRDAVEETNFQRERIQTQQFGPRLDELNRECQESIHRRNQYVHAIGGLTE